MPDIQYYKEYSPSLGRDMEFKIFGLKGKPVLVFPSFAGRFFQYEDFGMLEAWKPYLDDKRVQLFCVDSIDGETFGGQGDVHARIERQEAYFRYIRNEFIPKLFDYSNFINGVPQKIFATGCSMGAYHAANLFFRCPDVVDTLVGLSGVYHPRLFFGETDDPLVSLNAPLEFLTADHDDAYWHDIYRARLVFCAGQGAYDEKMLDDTLALKNLLDVRKIPAFVDIWGRDVTHDWPWWKKQMAYFLPRVLDF